MGVLVSGRRGGAGGGAGGKGERGGAGGSNSKGSSDKSGDATTVTRSATLLHIYVGSEARSTLDVIRRIVQDEKGAVVSAHEPTIVAAFNLMTPGGHHQVRAANAVMRLRAVLAVPFVCSIHHGKISALIAEGLVMCTGEAVLTGHALLYRALDMSGNLTRLRMKGAGGADDADDEGDFSDAKGGANSHTAVSIFTTSEGAKSPTSARGGATSAVASVIAAPPPLDNGLCVLHCAPELSSAYECEAVDMGPLSPALALPSSSPGAPSASTAPTVRVVFRLAHRKAGGAAKDDEWMYRMKNDEDECVFAVGNAIFARLAEGDVAEARRLWRASEADVISTGPLAAASIRRLLA